MESINFIDINYMIKNQERRVELERLEKVYNIIKNQGEKVKSKREARSKGNESKLNCAQLSDLSGVREPRKQLGRLISLGVAYSVLDLNYSHANHIYYIENKRTEKLEKLFQAFHAMQL